MRKYLVMECHLSYAVVLDEDGRFLKVANMNYEVGQTVKDVFEMHQPEEVKKKPFKWMYAIAAAAACLVIMATSVLYTAQLPYASVYMTINPEVRIDVNRNDAVVALEGINADGTELIEGYEYKKKQLDTVMDQLVDRAIDMGYLHQGGKISIVLDAENSEWVVSHSETLTEHLNGYVGEKLTVAIDVTDKSTQNSQIVIPVVPETEYSDSDYGVSDYGDSDYGESDYAAADGNSDYGTSNYEQSDYGTEAENSDYGESDYSAEGPEVEAESSYGDSSYYDGQTDYGNDDGESDYQQTVQPTATTAPTTNSSDYGENEEQSDYAQESASDYEEQAVSDYEEDTSDYEEDASDYEEYSESDYENEEDD